jgi:hypothetical protein
VEKLLLLTLTQKRKNFSARGKVPMSGKFSIYPLDPEFH